MYAAGKMAMADGMRLEDYVVVTDWLAGGIPPAHEWVDEIREARAAEESRRAAGRFA